METTKKYKNCFVIFIDMLGTQAKKDINSIYSDYYNFHSMLLSKDGKYITDGRGGGIISGEKIYMHSHTFSDCAYMMYSYDDEFLNSVDDKGILIENALCHFERIMLKLLNDGIVFRGGASFGEVFYEKDNNILFGPDINKAFQMEDKEAKYPRIIVSDDVAKLYNNHFEKCVKEFDNPIGDISELLYKLCQEEGIGNIKESQGRMIIKDESDYKYIINYLNSINTVSHIILPEIKTISLDFKNYFLHFAEEKRLEAESNSNISVQEKYEWLINYIRS